MIYRPRQILKGNPTAADQQGVGSKRFRLHEDGYTLVEVMVAAMILMAGVLGALTMLDGANRATNQTKAREAAINLAREAIEASRSVPYPKLIPAGVEAELQAQTGLEDSDGAGEWTIRRRNTLFTVTASVCSVDDNTIVKDGLGDHTGGFFCTDSSAQGTQDTNPDDYKRVALDVKWKDGSKTQTVRQEAVINNPGSAFAPAIKTLTSAPASPVLANVSPIVFTAVTSSRPVTVKWFVDNVQQGIASGTNTTWTFNWDLTTVDDGTYLVSALAFDQFGESGTGRTRTMVLNRFAPRTPTGFRAGRNGTFGVEFEWDPNLEPDISGYRVYRVTGAAPSAADLKVCETASADKNPTTCRDALALPSPAVLRYYVVAVAPARVGSGVEESARPANAGTTQVSNTNVVPNVPQGLTATAPGDGTIVLAWTTPVVPEAGEVGDQILYYRIYRDGQAYANRYDRTGAAADVSYTDTDPGPGAHVYSVAAVDGSLAESALVQVATP